MNLDNSGTSNSSVTNLINKLCQHLSKNNAGRRQDQCLLVFITKDFNVIFVWLQRFRPAYLKWQSIFLPHLLALTQHSLPATSNLSLYKFANIYWRHKAAKLSTDSICYTQVFKNLYVTTQFY